MHRLSKSISRCAFAAAVLFALAFASAALAPACAFADSSDTSTKRIIDVVYDDSGSMDTGSEWAQAHYALEALVGMMGPEDELNVYAMSGGDNAEPSVSVSLKSKSAQECVDEIRLFGGFCGRDSGIGPAQRAKTTIWN